MRNPIALLFAGAAALFVALSSAPSSAAEFMFRANINGQTLEGKPLSWDASHMLLLARDGQLHEFDPKLAADAVRTSSRFVPFTPTEMKTSLAREYGQRF